MSARLKANAQAKKYVFSRRGPEIPRDLISETGLALPGDRDVSVSGRLIEGMVSVRDAEGTLSIEAAVLEKVSLANCRFSSILLKDVRLNGCDLANLETRALTLVRVEFLNCRMTGLRAGETDGRDVLIGEGDQRYAQFRYSKFRSAEFDTCNFAEADFQGTDLSGCIFRKCNLQGAEMSKAKLMDADLRGSMVDGLHLTAQDIRGAVMDLSQAMTFVPLLGVRIE